MFIKPDGTDDLVFIKSSNINVFPCSRRRACIVENQQNRYIPFDPEARLNTEANNRKHSALNGFKQDYILNELTTANNELSLVLAGYLFNIKLPGYTSADILGAVLYTGTPTINSYIYANIRLETTSFFSDGDINATTEILRAQTEDENPDTDCLDVFYNSDDNNDVTVKDNYYFSGLSFSKNRVVTPSNKQRIVNLPILKYNGNTWQFYQPSKLPQVNHGDAPNSVSFENVTIEDTLNTKTINAESITLNERPAASLNVSSVNNGKYQLEFFYSTNQS
jgi:hypothetical protein